MNSDEPDHPGAPHEQEQTPTAGSELANSTGDEHADQLVSTTPRVNGQEPEENTDEPYAQQLPEASLWDIVKAAALVLLFQVMAGVFCGLHYILLNPGSRNFDIVNYLPVTMAVFFASLLFTSVYFRCRKYGRTISEGLAIRQVPGRTVAKSAALALVLFLLALLFTSLRQLLNPHALEDAPITEIVSSSKGLWMFIALAVLAPPFEELFFRGFMYPVVAFKWGKMMAVVIVSLLFALCHSSQLGGDIPSVLVILCLGFVLTLQRRATDSIVPGLITHWLYNTLFAGLVITAMFMSPQAVSAPALTHPSPPAPETIKADLLGHVVGSGRSNWSFDGMQEFQLFQILDTEETSDTLRYRIQVTLDGTVGPDAQAELEVTYSIDEAGYTLEEVTDNGTLRLK